MGRVIVVHMVRDQGTHSLPTQNQTTPMWRGGGGLGGGRRWEDGRRRGVSTPRHQVRAPTLLHVPLD